MGTVIVQRNHDVFELLDTYGECIAEVEYEDALFLTAALQKHLDELHAEWRADSQNESEQLAVAEGGGVQERETELEMKYDATYGLNDF